MIKTAIQLLKVSLKLSTKPLIISAGMPRSGSTLLFNILREILQLEYQDNLSSGWDGDITQLPKGSAYLVKTHHFNRFYRLRAQHSFYTYRDVRVAAISYMRKFNREPSMDWISDKIKQYMIAKNACDAVFRYEDLIAKPIHPIRKISQILNVTIDPHAIVAATFNLPLPTDNCILYSKKTLLHKDHFTHTKDEEWRHVFSKELQERVNEEFNWWFKECDYPES